MPVICDEIAKLAQTMDEEEGSRVPRRSLAGILMSREHQRPVRAFGQPSVVAVRPRRSRRQEIVAKVKRGHAGGCRRVARQIFGSVPLVSLGPVSRFLAATISGGA